MGGRQGKRTDRVTALCLGGLLASTAVVSAAAQSQPQPAHAVPGYAEAIAEAVAHYGARRWRDAHTAFTRAHALQPSARTHRGLGLTAFYLDDYAAARQAFEHALADTRRPLTDDQRREIEELMRSAASETGRFELRIAPPSARVEVDGAPTDRRVLFLARGEHVFSISAADHTPQRTALSVNGREDRILEFELEPVPPRAAAVASATGPRLPEPAPAAAARAGAGGNAAPAGASTHGGRVLSWVAAAAVPVFAGAAAAFWFTGKAERDAIERDCRRDGCDRAEADRRITEADLDAHETWTGVSLVLAGTALVAASVLFVVEGEQGGDVEPRLSRGGSEVALRGRF
jgi:hypothetical protein